jgi:hypothetical protein
MTLLYKPDWETAKAHYLAWWAGDAFERCAMAVTAPRRGDPAIHPPQPPSDPVERWTNLDTIAALNEYTHATTFYGGEAFPIWNGGYPGHTSLPTYLGCPLTLDMETGWWDPILTSPDWDITTLRFDPDNPWWQFTLAQVERSLKESAGKSIPDIGGALGGCGDTLAALRGTYNLLFDVTQCPQRVAQAEAYLLELWIQVYDTLYDLVHEAAGGSATWFPLWSPGRFYSTHCDFSYMISPKMFNRLFLPVIERWSQHLDHTVYHVDGIAAFAHVPALCDLPSIQAFQILPGAGKPGPLHYLETLRLVQSRGKNLHITLPAEEVETALNLLSARGLFIDTHCDSEEHARWLLAQAEKWSHDGT